MNRETIYVGPLSAVDHAIRESGVSHLMTLINDQAMIDTPPTIVPDNHLRLAMNDIAEPQPGLVPPSHGHVSELIEFAVSWDRKAPMLIHCWAGISRSTAAAFISLCALNPAVDEHRIAQAIRKASPTATPNRRLVQFADSVLEARRPHDRRCRSHRTWRDDDGGNPVLPAGADRSLGRCRSEATP